LSIFIIEAYRNTYNFNIIIYYFGNRGIKMRILITGAEGNMGSYFSKYFSDNHEIFAFGKSHMDVANKSQVLNVVSTIRPDIFIHAAGFTDIDLCEKNESSAYSVNTIGSLNTAYACNFYDIPIIYISCSSVYEGNKTSYYYETDDCAPVNTYGKTKLSGEELIRTICKKYFILRTSWIYGGEKCFVKNIIANKDVPIFMCSSDISTPTYIRDLCMVIEKLLTSDKYGIYNCVNNGVVKKSLWVKTILNHMQVHKDILEIPDRLIADRAKRPKCTSLNTSLLTKSFNVELPSWEDSLHAYLSSCI
jgi:dTDP-4-dehydrorhamnose reductase